MLHFLVHIISAGTNNGRDLNPVMHRKAAGLINKNIDSQQLIDSWAHWSLSPASSMSRVNPGCLEREGRGGGEWQREHGRDVLFKARSPGKWRKLKVLLSAPIFQSTTCEMCGCTHTPTQLTTQPPHNAHTCTHHSTLSVYRSICMLNTNRHIPSQIIIHYFNYLTVI